MATDILMPKMGESVQEGTILRWLKGPGDRVERDEIIAEMSTDKVDTEMPVRAWTSASVHPFCRRMARKAAPGPRCFDGLVTCLDIRTPPPI